jgi:hypothetical protein
VARLQTDLFDDLPAPVPAGCVIVHEFLTLTEEHELVALLSGLPLEAAQYKGHVARRRVASFGGRFDDH